MRNHVSKAHLCAAMAHLSHGLAAVSIVGGMEGGSGGCLAAATSSCRAAPCRRFVAGSLLGLRAEQTMQDAGCGVCCVLGIQSSDP